MSEWVVKECPDCKGIYEDCSTCSGTGQIEEVNTAYDQNQPIGDTPSDYPAVGGEPIDARTGDDFMTVKKLQEDTKPKKEYKNVWQKLDDMVKESYSKIEESLDDHFDHHEYDPILEDGYSYQDYEGTGGYFTCKICNTVIEYDGWSSDAEEQLEEHLEEQHQIITEKLNKDGTGVTRATRGIDPTKTPAQVLQFVYVSKSECETCKQYDGQHFPIDSPNRPVIPRLEEGDDIRPYTHPNCKCKWVRPFSKSGMKNFEQTRGGEALTKEAKTFQQHYDMIEKETRKKYPDYDDMDEQKQRMLFIKTGLDKLTESVADEDVLDPVPWASMATQMFNAIQPTIKSKLGRYAEAKENESPYGIQKMLDMFVDKSLTREEKVEIEKEHNLDFTLENLLRLVAEKIAEKASKKMGLESRTKATEGGVGSGKKGHQKWMRGAYAGEECSNCMIRTEKKDGKCAICGL